VTLHHIDPMCSLFLSSSHIGLHALLLLPKPHTLGFGFIVTLTFCESKFSRSSSALGCISK
jgi:hypothetical protein